MEAAQAAGCQMILVAGAQAHAGTSQSERAAATLAQAAAMILRELASGEKNSVKPQMNTAEGKRFNAEAQRDAEKDEERFAAETAAEMLLASLGMRTRGA